MHIFRLDPQPVPGDRLEPEYQANYSTPGNAYVRTYTERRLKDLLRHSLGLDEQQVMRTVQDLRAMGKFTLADVELTSEQIASLGLEQVPTDF